MTISSTTRIAQHNGNGSASTFAFSFKVFAASDLQVIRLTNSTGVETTLALTTDYTVALNGNQNTNPGGSITLVAGALAVGFTLTITSDIANLQPTDLTNQGGFYPEVITDALDRATIQIQQLADGKERAVRAPVSDPIPINMDLPPIAERAGKFLTFDGAGEPTVSSGTGTDTALRTDLANQTALSAGAGLVGFRQTDASATGRTSLSKLRETVSVLDFGAVGDGVTNDAAAFNAAWTARSPNPVLVPPGSYAITGTVTGEFYTFGTVTIVGGTVNTINRFTGAMRLDGSVFVVDATNNRVGINTASPAQALDVTGNAAVSGDLTAGGDLGVTGDLTVTGNDIKSSTATAITMSGTNVTVVGDLAVNGADITTTASGTATVFNATATTVNVGGAATAMAVGSQSSGTVTVNNLSMNAGYGSIAPVFGCRAWVNFNGDAANNLSGTYSQSGFTVTVTANNHGLSQNSLVYVDITSGTAVDGTYTVATASQNTFTYTAGTSLTTSGNCTLVRGTIRGSGNVSSIANVSTGRFIVNFVTPMPDINYCVVATGSSFVGGGAASGLFATEETTSGTVLSRTTASTPILFFDSGIAVDNPLSGNVVVFR